MPDPSYLRLNARQIHVLTQAEDVCDGAIAGDDLDDLDEALLASARLIVEEHWPREGAPVYLPAGFR